MRQAYSDQLPVDSDTTHFYYHIDLPDGRIAVVSVDKVTKKRDISVLVYNPTIDDWDAPLLGDKEKEAIRPLIPATLYA